MHKKDVKLYNLIFPLWMIVYLSSLLGNKEGFIVLFIVLIANFIIDSLVYLISLKKLNIENIKEKYKKGILKIWLFGFLSDILGVIPMFAVNFLTEIPMSSEFRRWFIDNFVNAVTYNPFKSIFAFLWVLMCIGISMFCIYKFNYKISMKKIDIEKDKKKKIAMIIAIITAPYLFLIPTMGF